MTYTLKSIVSKAPFKVKSVVENHIVNYPAPATLYYAWGVGSLLGILLAIQVVTGVLLAMHYVPHINEAFTSVERAMREIPSGWFLRYMHSNGSSMLFILLYAHIARGLFFASYRKPRQWVWCSGAILFILMAGISFLGYTLPWGQMSFWGATVITNLLSAIPFVGSKIVVWVWGGFAINANTLNRFFSLHYFLSIIALALAVAHLVLLHAIGSSTPVANETELDLAKFSPLFVVKDAFTFVVFLFVYFILVIYKPNMFGHPDNFIRADALVTPAHIVPEWYFLPFYAMLKAFPSKAAGALAMVTSMLILLSTPWMDNMLIVSTSSSDPRFRPLFRIMFLLFVTNMLSIGWLGGLAVSEVNYPFSQACTAIYFLYFMTIIPLVSWLEVGDIFKHGVNEPVLQNTLLIGKNNGISYINENNKHKTSLCRRALNFMKTKLPGIIICPLGVKEIEPVVAISRASVLAGSRTSLGTCPGRSTARTVYTPFAHPTGRTWVAPKIFTIESRPFASPAFGTKPSWIKQSNWSYDISGKFFRFSDRIDKATEGRGVIIEAIGELPSAICKVQGGNFALRGEVLHKKHLREEGHTEEQIHETLAKHMEDINKQISVKLDKHTTETEGVLRNIKANTEPSIENTLSTVVGVGTVLFSVWAGCEFMDSPAGKESEARVKAAISAPTSDGKDKS